MSQSSMMLELSQQEDLNQKDLCQLTLYTEDSHVRTLVQAVKELVLSIVTGKLPEADYGEKCAVSLAKLTQDGLWLKTYGGFFQSLLLTEEPGGGYGIVLRDLAQMGYRVGWSCYGAADVGAIHTRNRVAVVAYSSSVRWRGLDQMQQEGLPVFRIQNGRRWAFNKGYLPFDIKGLFHKPKRGILRNDDGLSEGMDRLKSLGNAVVPQQFYPVFKAIAEIEKTIKEVA